jgi:hypothetical protein
MKRNTEETKFMVNLDMFLQNLSDAMYRTVDFQKCPYEFPQNSN